MRAKARCFLTCSRLIRADVCPRAFFCTVTVWDCIGRMSDVLLMHRHGAVASGFLGCLSGILFVQLCRCDSFTPRGGGQRERRRTLRSPSPFSPTPLNLFPGNTAAAGMIRLPRVYRDIVCAIPVLSFIATSIYRLGAMCSGWYPLRFSRDVRHESYVFHLC